MMNEINDDQSIISLYKEFGIRRQVLDRSGA